MPGGNVWGYPALRISWFIDIKQIILIFWTKFTQKGISGLKWKTCVSFKQNKSTARVKNSLFQLFHPFSKWSNMFSLVRYYGNIKSITLACLSFSIAVASIYCTVIMLTHFLIRYVLYHIRFVEMILMINYCTLTVLCDVLLNWTSTCVSSGVYKIPPNPAPKSFQNALRN